MMNIAVIGAGPSGLCSAKHSLAHGFNVTVYEQHEKLGGTWNYTEEKGVNRFGVEFHSVAYRDLRY